MKHRIIVLSSLVALVFVAGCNKPTSVVGPSSSTSGNWTQVNGLTGFNTIVSDGNNLYAAGSNGVYLSTDQGSDWTVLDTNLTGSFTIAALNGDLFIGDNSTAQNGIYRSTDGGRTWVAKDSGLSTPFSGLYQTINCFGINGKTIFAGTSSNGIFKSTDNGDSWSPANNGVSYGASVSCFTVSGSNVIAGTQSGTYLSTDDGATWTANDSGLVNTSPYYSGLPYVMSLAVNGGILYAGAYGAQVYLSQDNGQSWLDIGANLPGSGQSAIGIAASDSSLVVVDDNGIFKSTNGGNNWQSINGNLPNNGIYAFDKVPGYIFVELGNSTVWRLAI